MPGIVKLAPEVSIVDWAKASEQVLPPLMHDPVTFAVPFFLLSSRHRVGRGAQARPHRERARTVRRLPEARRVGQHLDGRRVRRHQRGDERHRAVRLRGALCLRRAVAAACHRLVHVGDRHSSASTFSITGITGWPIGFGCSGQRIRRTTPASTSTSRPRCGRSGTSAATSSCARCSRCSACRRGSCSPASRST